MKKNPDTSWENSSKWYNDIVGQKGHYYHEHTILPALVSLLQLQDNAKLLDVGAGQGILANYIAKTIRYVGIDISPSLINQAKQKDKNSLHHYIIADAVTSLPIKEHDFTHAVFLLSLQNMNNPQQALLNAGSLLQKNARLVIVLNHPAFRIPRQSGWGVHQENNIRYRYINRYLSPLKIPITMHPGNKTATITWSFHHSISDYTKFLHHAGFVIEYIEEWSSDKKSQGKYAKSENRAREEIPMFLTIIAKKQ